MAVQSLVLVALHNIFCMMCSNYFSFEAATKNILPKFSVSNFKNVGFKYNFKGLNSFEFIKFETRWDCRSYRIYSVRCHTA